MGISVRENKTANTLVVGCGWTEKIADPSKLTTKGVQALGGGGATTTFRQVIPDFIQPAQSDELERRYGTTKRFRNAFGCG